MALDAVRKHGRCMACETVPAELEMRREWNEALLIARCHGQYAVFHVPDTMFEGDDSHLFDRSVMFWVCRLFIEQAMPDMIEIYRYNREPWEVVRG